MSYPLFKTADLAVKSDEILAAAEAEPVFLTDDTRLRYVIMTMDEYARLNGREKKVCRVEDLPPEMVDELKNSAK